MITIPVEPAQTLVSRPAVTVTVANLSVTSIIDEPMDRRVTANFRELGSRVLWEGDAYDAAGQWTDADVENRIKEIFDI